MNDNSFDSEHSNDSTTAVRSNVSKVKIEIKINFWMEFESIYAWFYFCCHWCKQSPIPDPDQAMILPNAVADNNHNHNNNIDVDADEQEEPHAAINEQLNQFEADLEPTIDLLEQLKSDFDKMNGLF